MLTIKIISLVIKNFMPYNRMSKIMFFPLILQFTLIQIVKHVRAIMNLRTCLAHKLEFAPTDTTLRMIQLRFLCVKVLITKIVL